MACLRPFGLLSAALLILALPACSDGGGGRPRDGGMDMIDAPTARIECSADDPGSCDPGFVCAAVAGVPRCVPDMDRPPPGDGTDCRPCPAPGECRMSVCVQPSPTGEVCEFDAQCDMGQLCISGRCSRDPRVPVPCTDASMCPTGMICGPMGTCECDTTTDCPLGLLCMMGLCVPPGTCVTGGGGCIADADCTAAQVCEAGCCRNRTLCDIGNPDLSTPVNWRMTSTLRVGESLPSWIGAVEEPFRFLGGDSTCIDWSGLPDWVDTAICDLVRPYVDMYLPPWAMDLFRAIADLNVILDTWVIDETMTLTRGGVMDSYRGTHTWDRVTFMHRAMPIVGDPLRIMSWRFSPSDFNASATCGTFNIERHDINVSISGIIAWLVDTLVYEVSGHMWMDLRDALTDVADGFCDGLASAAESIDYPGVAGTVRSICSGIVASAVDRAIMAVLDAAIGADAITLQGTATIGGPNTLAPGHWDGTLLGRGFTGDFEALR
jgi:hypothetical protein